MPHRVCVTARFAPLLLILGQASAQTPDISGTWVGDAATPVGAIEVVYRLKQSGSHLSGSQALSVGESPIIDGEFKGEAFSFTVDFSLFGAPRQIMGSGRIEGDTLLIIPAIPPPPGGAIPKPLVFHRGFPTGGMAVDPMDYRSLPAVRLPTLRKLPDNGLAMTPPMGWNSWNKFQTHVSDQLVREMADALVKSGLKAAGYVYVNIDDGWQGGRDAQGVLQPNARFPDMPALARYIHARGLKLGLYSSPGPRTCGGFEGSYGHEEKDARIWASWGVDYIKYDWCSAGQVWRDESDMRAVYQRMGEALRRAKRRMVFSVCQYGLASVEEWAPLAGANLWRTSFDITDAWERMSEIGFAQSRLARFARPGHWNDPDMLEIGNGKMTDDEYRSHFSLWAILAAPLIAGNDLRDMAPSIADILLNKEVIAVDQDPLGRQGERVTQEGETEIWLKSLRRGAALGIFNRGPAVAQVSATWAALGLSRPRAIRDLWAHADLAVSGDGLSVPVPGHGVVMLEVDQ